MSKKEEEKNGVQKSYIMDSNSLEIIESIKTQFNLKSDSQALRTALEMFNKSSLYSYTKKTKKL